MASEAQQAKEAQITLRWQLVEYFEAHPHVEYAKKEALFDLLRDEGIEATNTQLRIALRKLHYINAIRMGQPQLRGSDGQFARRWFVRFVQWPATV